MVTKPGNALGAMIRENGDQYVQLFRNAASYPIINLQPRGPQIPIDWLTENGWSLNASDVHLAFVPDADAASPFSERVTVGAGGIVQTFSVNDTQVSSDGPEYSLYQALGLVDDEVNVDPGPARLLAHRFSSLED